MLRIFLICYLVFSIFPSLASECRAPKNTVIPDIRLEMFSEGLEDPVAITHARDGSDRLFVIEQDGLIRIIDATGKLLATPFLDVRNKIRAGGEKGLLGLAFHPDYKNNGKFYVNYTRDDERLETVIAEYRSNDKNQALSNSERILLTIAQPWGNHNGGHLAFGPDNYLYIGLGDGGSANDPHNNGQRPKTLLGSMLRIDVDRQDQKTPYAIPGDNPFVSKNGIRPETWAYGLRNPWRFSFDRENGLLYAADVGQDNVEEINIIQKGGNYGWRVMEGDICTPGVNPNCRNENFIAPIYTYTHRVGRSITGGYVYRGQRSPKLCGTYLYGDFVNQAIWGLRYENGKVITQKTLFSARSTWRLAIDYFKDDGLLISTFGEDEAGEVYVAAYQSGRIYRIVAK